MSKKKKKKKNKCDNPKCDKPAVARLIGLGAFQMMNVCAKCGREYADYLKAQYEALKANPESEKYGQTAEALDRDTYYCKWLTAEEALKGKVDDDTTQ